MACGGFVCFLFLLYIVCLYYAVRYISLTKIEHDCLYADIICIAYIYEPVALQINFVKQLLLNRNSGYVCFVFVYHLIKLIVMHGDVREEVCKTLLNTMGKFFTYPDLFKTHDIMRLNLLNNDCRTVITYYHCITTSFVKY